MCLFPTASCAARVGDEEAKAQHLGYTLAADIAMMNVNDNLFVFVIESFVVNALFTYAIFFYFPN